MSQREQSNTPVRHTKKKAVLKKKVMRGRKSPEAYTGTRKASKVHMYTLRPSQLLMGQDLSDQKMIEKVRDGLPLQSVVRFSESMKMSDREPILKNIGMSERTYQRRKQSKQSLGPIESDRLYRLAKIEARAIEVFEDKDTAIDWLKTENRVLGASPLSLLDTEAGTDQVETILVRIEHGVYS